MILAGQELAEEAVGFGVPVLKRGLQTIFPGEVKLASSSDGSIQKVTADFKLNLEEKIARPGTASVSGPWLYAFKNLLAALIRRFAPLRWPLTSLSNTLRALFGWETLFEASGFAAGVTIVYAVDAGRGIIKVEVTSHELLKGGITEVVVMNEQGAHPLRSVPGFQRNFSAGISHWLLG